MYTSTLLNITVAIKQYHILYSYITHGMNYNLSS